METSLFLQGASEYWTRWCAPVVFQVWTTCTTVCTYKVHIKDSLSLSTLKVPNARPPQTRDCICIVNCRQAHNCNMHLHSSLVRTLALYNQRLMWTGNCTFLVHCTSTDHWWGHWDCTLPSPAHWWVHLRTCKMHMHSALLIALTVYAPCALYFMHPTV